MHLLPDSCSTHHTGSCLAGWLHLALALQKRELVGRCGVLQVPAMREELLMLLPAVTCCSL